MADSAAATPAAPQQPAVPADTAAAAAAATAADGVAAPAPGTKPSAKRARTDEPSDADADGKAVVEERKEKKRPRLWSDQEDEVLRAAVNAHGGKNWKGIAEQVPGRDHVQCLQRWKKVLEPGLLKGQWTSQEDAMLVVLVGQGFKNWSILSEHMQGRTSKQCRERWTHHLDPSINRGPYSAEEDKTILDLQGQMGNKWSEIARMLPGRTENAVKIRWKQLQRDPNDKSGPAPPTKWKPEDDAALELAVQTLGEKNWRNIAEQVPGRDHVQCLQRWKKVLKPGLMKGTWRADEDTQLVHLVCQGFKNWGQLAARMTGRTSKQCRERWTHHIDPSVYKGEWTAEEDTTIIEVQAQVGNKWSKIASMLPGRTENAVKSRCKALKRARDDPDGKPIRSWNTPDPELKSMAARAAAIAMAKQQEGGSSAAGLPQDPKLVAQIVLTQQSQHANHQLATQFVQMRQSERAEGKAAEGAADDAADPSMPTPADGAAAANAMALAQQAVVNNGAATGANAAGVNASAAQAAAAAAAATARAAAAQTAAARAAAVNMAAASSSASGPAGVLGAAAMLAQQQQQQAQAQAQMQAAAAAQAQVGVAYGGPAAALQEAAALSEANI